MFTTTCLFGDTISATEKTVVHQGGTSSGKTYTILQVLFYKAICNKCIITVVGESIPSLRKGAWRDAQGIVGDTPQLKQYISTINKTDRIIYFENGSLMEFCSFETPASAKAGKRQYLFIDECNNVSYDVYFQLSIRTTIQEYLAYNPTARFWVHDKLIGLPTVKLIISDHRHNPFLPEDKHDEIESISDKYLFDTYARGRTGTLAHHVYTNWVKIRDQDFPDDDNYAFALDFGYSKDPTAAVKCVLKGDGLYIKEICYRQNLSTEVIKQILIANGCDSHHPVFSDHSPEMISELRRAGITVFPAKKGNGSIMAGILALRHAKVYYTASSYNLQEELNRYVFMQDKRTGAVLNTPIDSYNHLLDAVRYFYYTYIHSKMARNAK